MKRTPLSRSIPLAIGAGLVGLVAGSASVLVAAPSDAAGRAAAVAVAPHPVNGDVLHIGPNGTFGGIVDCPAGEVVTGGGGYASDPYALRLSSSYQSGSRAWVAYGQNVSSRTVDVYAQAICTRP
ncbi:hypothetical protein [Streptomyces sp. NPDC037389]|uniref:hypothetical protein n=1 Tax=Streptomyces sp. NPDC037389 TaxID=3155369 RepID=UPI0033D682DA